MTLSDVKWHQNIIICESDSVFICLCVMWDSSPKNEMLSSLLSSRSYKPVWMCLFWTHRKIFSIWIMWEKSSSGAPLTSIVLFFFLWKSMVAQNSPFTNFLQNIFLCVQNKDIHTGLELLEVSKWWQHFHFWVNYPFK